MCPAQGIVVLSVIRRNVAIGPSEGEFIALMALLMSLVALSIDAMLPALGEIGAEMGVASENGTQLVVSALFLGLMLGQMVYGPLSDSYGRKPPIYAGIVIFIAGSLLSALATNFYVMLIGRVLQGLGVAGPRIVVNALVRDRYQGRAMARIMSMVMSVFILVPALAPALGQGVMALSGWRSIFGVFLVLATVTGLWFWHRLPESLTPEARVPLSRPGLYAGIRESCLNRASLGYAVAGGLAFGAFVGYLTSAQQIFQELYGLGTQFPLYFAILAVSLGCASLVNAQLVLHVGMRPLCIWALLVQTGVCTGFLVYALLTVEPPSLWAFMTCFVVTFFCVGILFGNLNALAMEPLGHIAGAASTTIGTIMTGSSLLFGTLIGAAYDGTVLPLVGGFALLGFFSLLVIRWAGQRPEADRDHFIVDRIGPHCLSSVPSH